MCTLNSAKSNFINSMCFVIPKAIKKIMEQY